MNILQALKSERKFRLKSAENQAWISKENLKDGRLTIYLKDMVSDDWELEDQKVLITKKQCQKIFEFGQHHGSYSQTHNEAYASYKSYLIELGFEEEE